MAASLPPLPSQFKSLGHYLKLAGDFDGRDPVIAYWCRFHAVQTALSIDKSSPEAKSIIISLLGILEQKKKELHDNESVTNDAVAEAYIEEYILKIFSWADSQDRASIFNKNVVKAFYNAGVLTDVLTNFNNGTLSEEFEAKRKYAKWKAAYIHNCLKNGEIPIPGPMVDEEDEFRIDVPPGPPAASSSSSDQQDMNNFERFEPKPPTNRFDPGPAGNPTSYYSPPAEPAQPPTNTMYSSGYQVDLTPPAASTTPGGAQLSVEQIAKAQKYCKWAGSALTFDDVPAAIMNLEKAVLLLKTGKDG